MKNKVAPPFRDAEFDIMFDRGISYEGDLIDLAVLANVVEKSGAWYTYKALRLGQGRENSKNYLVREPGPGAGDPRKGAPRPRPGRSLKSADTTTSDGE